MDWKIGLDRYLTSPPEDDFDNWCEDVLGHKLSDSFYNANEEWVDDNNGQCNKWLNKLYDKGKSPTEAAQIIERTFNIYTNK